MSQKRGHVQDVVEIARLAHVDSDRDCDRHGYVNDAVRVLVSRRNSDIQAVRQIHQPRLPPARTSHRRVRMRRVWGVSVRTEFGMKSW